jgi:histone arginine demethylase JMJD6
MRAAKKAHRPSLKDWEGDGFYDSFPQHLRTIQDHPSESLILSSSSLSKEDGHPLHHLIASKTPLPIQLDARTLTTDTFRREYDAQNIPCIIHNIPLGYDNAEQQPSAWAARHAWTFETFHQVAAATQQRRQALRECLFKCGEDDHGKAIKVKLKYFLRYMQENRDDSPLYIFDSNFDGRGKFSRKLLQEYSVPSYFRNDLFEYISASRRPPYRWILIGPQRSGSCVHIDPLATHAWNTLLVGLKRWVLFPPHIPKHVVKGTALMKAGEDDEAVHYFTTILPRIKEHAAPRHLHDADYHNFACYEFTQQAGETVFVPHGWWHAVLNLTHTIGVTQNYASTTQFDDVWTRVRSSRKRMAGKLLEQLRRHHPDLARRAVERNQQDGFVMKYDPVVPVEQRHQNEAAVQPRKIPRAV